MAMTDYDPRNRGPQGNIFSQDEMKEILEESEEIMREAQSRAISEEKVEEAGEVIRQKNKYGTIEVDQADLDQWHKMYDDPHVIQDITDVYTTIEEKNVFNDAMRNARLYGLSDKEADSLIADIGKTELFNDPETAHETTRALIKNLEDGVKDAKERVSHGERAEWKKVLQKSNMILTKGRAQDKTAGADEIKRAEAALNAKYKDELKKLAGAKTKLVRSGVGQIGDVARIGKAMENGDIAGAMQSVVGLGVSYIDIVKSVRDLVKKHKIKQQKRLESSIRSELGGQYRYQTYAPKVEKLTEKELTKGMQELSKSLDDLDIRAAQTNTTVEISLTQENLSGNIGTLKLVPDTGDPAHYVLNGEIMTKEQVMEELKLQTRDLTNMDGQVQGLGTMTPAQQTKAIEKNAVSNMSKRQSERLSKGITKTADKMKNRTVTQTAQKTAQQAAQKTAQKAAEQTVKVTAKLPAKAAAKSNMVTAAASAAMEASKKIFESMKSLSRGSVTKSTISR